MNNLTYLSVTATTETVLKKLSKANIAVFNVKKRANTCIFQVQDEYIKKVFAIFKHPCYNICIRRKSRFGKWLTFAINRCGVLVGIALFLASVLFSQSYVLKINYIGNGSYLKTQASTILQQNGVSLGKLYSSKNLSIITAEILSLPNVCFCSVRKDGGVLTVDIRTAQQSENMLSFTPLYSDCDGILQDVVVICGTQTANCGEKISKDDAIISPFSVDENGNVTKSLVVGYATIVRSATISLPFEDENEQNLSSALSSTLLYSDSVLEKTYQVKRTENGVIFDVTFTYLHTISINLE